MVENNQTSQAQAAAANAEQKVTQAVQQTQEAAATGYSYWQKAKDFTRANPGTVLGLAVLVIFIIGVVFH